MNELGLVKVGLAVPELKIGNIKYNIENIIKLVKEGDKNKTEIMVFPELSITGYTCGDLFLQDLILEKCLEGLNELVEQTKDYDVLYFVGMPININSALYNCAVGIYKGEIKGIVPKMYLPNYKEFYEKRWFTEGSYIIKQIKKVMINDKEVPFGNIIFESKNSGYKVGVEICEDLWVTIPPSSLLTLNGANIIVNLSASNELVGKSDYRKSIVSTQSAKGICGYLYCSSGIGESTSDLLFGGDAIIAENGSILKTNERFNIENSIIYSEIDIKRLEYDRNVNKSFADNSKDFYNEYTFVQIKNKVDYSINFDKIPMLERTFSKSPFVPSNEVTKNKRCEEIFNIQTSALAKRLITTNIKKIVLGISGGLDSTLALLVVYKTFKKLNLPFENIIGITMPGFGTTKNTYNNSMELMKTLGITIKDINIKEACIQHFKDIEHDINVHDITYENVQARERTQILMDIANKENGLVIGTGDLSELALGWCTYNGDHMSMYNVNASIPKTLVKFLVKWVAEYEMTNKASLLLERIVDTPISPELLPPDKNGNIVQKTENSIGSYELHDFFLYYFIRWGMSPKKILLISLITFKDIYTREEIIKCLNIFIKRFFSMQFKRNCVPDGVKVGTISLSPRGDWRMPSDADVSLWLKELH